MRYFTADPHFGHLNIIKSCNRPFKNENIMDRSIIHSYNSIITEDDDLIIVGDYCMKTARHRDYYLSITKKIKGRKILILGNHDDLRPRFYLDIGFHSVHTSLETKIKDIDVVLTHDYTLAILNPTTLHLCGHAHHLFHHLKNIINVGVDVNDFLPVSEESIYEQYQIMKIANFR